MAYEHQITLRLNDRDYDYLNEIIANRDELQEEEGIHYSISDVLRTAIHYMHDMEVTQCMETIYHRELDPRYDENGQYIKSTIYDSYGNWLTRSNN